MIPRDVSPDRSFPATVGAMSDSLAHSPYPSNEGQLWCPRCEAPWEECLARPTHRRRYAWTVTAMTGAVVSRG